ncbi:hypothetical protein HBI56_111830 [Parastagonospora nodorum]|uniref:Uncharacterized protein n=1 Tax=Phaeosphaeria nodorum (strain SN15 / ATCC MYA-4574 / FGSC 10173) TaxID=321614 RepID=A0A7U2EVQ9_PHANO|nr:hypothetical protein HBH56_044450 [Parastagonospora nodorum]QRC92763.1 hypothetical protein JI435_081820 [Parastagonospora nodorum SN15]KAH3932905.1 hypothetical protein HBH54_072200 [Parastagonospora nodorum]KAH3946405.1 hypothetical protein HBH53_131380 [Parastagonospora nodorum]KAH3973223.1 hypothetical protein HBH52_144260 [Parastagonospora nodorum]
MDSQPPLHHPSPDVLMPTTEVAGPETPRYRAQSRSESAAPVNMSKLPSPDRVKFTSPPPRTTSSMTPPPSSQLPNSRAAMRTPTPPTPQLTSPPPTSKLPNQPSVLTDAAAALYSQERIDNASPDELRSMVHSLSDILRDVRLSAAHYKLQYNMAAMESQESASRMAVELAMAQREIDVLQQAEEKRRSSMAPPEPTYQESANAANAIMISEMNRHNQMLQSENEELRNVYEQQKRLTEHREGELASLIEENDRLKTRIRMNRDHIAPLLEQIGENSPRSVYGTPHQPTPRQRVSRAPTLSSDARGQSNFEALLLADKMLSQETATAPTTPVRASMQRSRYGHHRGAQSMSSLPQTPNRRIAQPRAEVPRTPPAYIPATIPQSAPPAHYGQKPATARRQSSNSTITASSVDEEEAYTDREEDEVKESQASQMATSMLRKAPASKMSAPPPTSSNLVQSKIFGQVKKGHGLTRPGENEKRRLQSTPSTEQLSSPMKRGRVNPGVGLGIGGLLRD